MDGLIVNALEEGMKYAIGLIMWTFIQSTVCSKRKAYKKYFLYFSKVLLQLQLFLFLFIVLHCILFPSFTSVTDDCNHKSRANLRRIQKFKLMAAHLLYAFLKGTSDVPGSRFTAHTMHWYVYHQYLWPSWNKTLSFFSSIACIYMPEQRLGLLL